MPQAFLTSPSPTSDIQVTVTTKPTLDPSREKVKLLLIGSSYATDLVIHELYRVGFAEVREWSKPLTTGNYGEVMRILTRHVVVEN